jgi:hypothetical protein
VLGDTVNFAARLQALAEPDSVRTRTRTLDPLIKSQLVTHQAQWVECKTSQKQPLQINRISANCKMLPAPADHGRVGPPLDLKPAELGRYWH